MIPALSMFIINGSLFNSRKYKVHSCKHPVWHMKKVNMKSLMCNRGSLNHAHTEKDPARLTRKWLNGHKTIGNPTGFSKQFDLCILFLSKKWQMSMLVASWVTQQLYSRKGNMIGQTQNFLFALIYFYDNYGLWLFLFCNKLSLICKILRHKQKMSK